MYNFKLTFLNRHAQMEDTLEELQVPQRQATFLLVNDWDEVCGKLLTRLRTSHHDQGFMNREIFILDSWDIPDGTQMLRESFDIKTRINRVPSLVVIKDNNVSVITNNDAVYRELGL